MPSALENAALVLLIRHGRRSAQAYAELVEEAGSAVAVLESDEAQRPLFVPDPRPDLDATVAEIKAWAARGIQLISVLDPRYPQNLLAVHDRPPLLFVAGALAPEDARSLAVIGSRNASADGIAAAQEIAQNLVERGYTVTSGLAAGIDTAAHRAALARGGRTVAVIGTGLLHSYPPQNADLQRLIATQCAVVSQFWPEAPPSRRSFPMRNAVMSGMSLGTVIVEASHTSGTRVQARLALAHGRPVFLNEPLLKQEWAQELATRAGTHVVRTPEDIAATTERLTVDAPLSA
jgi:DNA processing protein